MVAMHARTARQMFLRRGRLTHLALLEGDPVDPVIGNGDVRQPEDALECRPRPVATA